MASSSSSPNPDESALAAELASLSFSAPQSSSSAAETTVKLVTADEHVFEVSTAVAEKCETLRHVIEDGCTDGVIPVTNVEWEILAMVLRWCEHEAAIGVKPDWDEEEGKKWEEKKSKWEHEYVDSFTTDELYHLIMAANYLTANKLVDRLTKKIADMIKGKHPDEIRRIFGIKNDFEPEVYKKMVEDNGWAFNLATGCSSSSSSNSSN